MSDVLAAIDGAFDDYSVSDDAMRWTPAPTPARPSNAGLTVVDRVGELLESLDMDQRLTWWQQRALELSLQVEHPYCHERFLEQRFRQWRAEQRISDDIASRLQPAPGGPVPGVLALHFEWSADEQPVDASTGRRFLELAETAVEFRRYWLDETVSWPRQNGKATVSRRWKRRRRIEQRRIRQAMAHRERRAARRRRRAAARAQQAS